MDAKAEKIALFRYALVAPLVLERLPRGELTRRAAQIAARHDDMPDSKRRAVTVDTLLEWAKRYRAGGFEALAPQPCQGSRAIARDHTATGRPPRTPQARKPASHRRHAVARISSVVRAQ